MNNIRNLFKAHLTILYLVLGASGDDSFDYKQNGADWPNLTIEGNNCGGKNQSPIDVSRNITVDDDWSDEDGFMKMYSNQKGIVAVNWEAHSERVNLSTDTTNVFESRFCKVELDGPQRFNAAQFHFHHQSEHTIDGQRYDLEMHTVHDPVDPPEDNKIVAAAVGILFSVDNWDKDRVSDWEIEIIDAFFDSLSFPEDTSTDTYNVSLVKYGDLMGMINSRSRWIYKGSVTTPPCATFVYWNLIDTVYPIKQKHMDEYINQMKRSNGLTDTGNYRQLQKIDDQDLMLIRAPEDKSGNKERAYMIGTYVLLSTTVLLFIGMVIVTIAFFKKVQPQ